MYDKELKINGGSSMHGWKPIADQEQRTRPYQITDLSLNYTVRPNGKRKPVLSVRYLHCHARFNQTDLYMLHYQGHFLFFHLIPNT